MRNRRHIAKVSAIGLLALGMPGLIDAAGGAKTTQQQPGAEAPASSTASSETADLSSGDKVIVDALYRAQVVPPKDGAPLSRGEIAAMRHDGQSWLQVFAEMKDRGLVRERNLGRLIAKQSGREETTDTVAADAPKNKDGDYVEAGLKRRDGAGDADAQGAGTSSAETDAKAQQGAAPPTQ